jgi:eukaryotic-like serine/threonine-protein kinase
MAELMWKTDPNYLELQALIGERTRRIVPWCGAGLSMPAGMPSWSDLRGSLEVAYEAKLKGLDLGPELRAGRLSAIRAETNPWVAFERLESELGQTSYRDNIRRLLSGSPSAKVPEAYFAMWKLRPWGVITLNLDGLASRAIGRGTHPSEDPAEFQGDQIGDYMHLLSTPRTFLCNIHGIAENHSSWIFTQTQLKKLMATHAYKVFLSSVLTTTTVVFLGISAEDIAVGSHLEVLAKKGVTLPTHFWLTNRREEHLDRWAEKNGVRIIRYGSLGGGHDELTDILGQLATHLPHERVAPPIVPHAQSSASKGLSVAELLSMGEEQIRVELNTKAAEILRSGSGAEERYAGFSHDFDRAIHAAWYASVESGSDTFLGYRLIREVARGAFAIVFLAEAQDGTSVAIKLLHNEIRKTPGILNAFRRGVRSMQIVSSQGLSGIPKFIEAAEIPAVVVMEWIEGASLKEVVEAGRLSDWSAVCDTASQITEIILSAHLLPQRVLHRDIRPTNVILEGFWEDEVVRVRVLDFDLSWHPGAVEKSVVWGSALAGYLAPEQMTRRVGVSTQNAAVDAFGIGMTLFFLVSRRNPSPGEHSSKDWQLTVNNAARDLRATSWRSLPRRFARLIIGSTRDAQFERIDVTQISKELRRLSALIVDAKSRVSAEFIAEELAARSAVISNYFWDEARCEAHFDFGTGLTVCVRGDDVAQQVSVKIERHAMATDNRNSLGDAIKRVGHEWQRVLQKGGWGVSLDVGRGSLAAVGRVSTEQAIAGMEKLFRSIDEAVDRSRFT